MRTVYESRMDCRRCAYFEKELYMSFNKKDACIPDGVFKEMLRADQAYDWRLLTNGTIIPTLSYADQPYVVKADDGALVCVVTTGQGHEGDAGQHVAVLRSTDDGKTWSDPVAVESPANPESSYAVLLKVSTGRIYCFYNYNEDNIREVPTVFPGNPPTFRMDTLGYHVFKYSDDHGCSWSENYYKVPIRETEVDRENTTGGKIRFMWNVGRPFVLDGAAFISIHKVSGFGDGFLAGSEGWLVKSENILTETDPEKILWETLPEGETGLRTPPGGGPVSEEQSYAVLSDRSIYCVYRTIDGWLAESYSRDAGRHWSVPQYKCYADGRRMKNPRAAAFVWRCRNGKYLQWFHNHGGRFIGEHGLDEPVKSPYEDRNPVWISAGIETDGPDGKRLEWSQPEVLLYDDDPLIRMSYPDMIELDDGMYITETQKNIARIHKIDPAFLDKLFGQFEAESAPEEEDGLLVIEKGGCTVPMPALPKFVQRDRRRADAGKVDLRQGFSILLQCAVPGAETLLDNRTKSGIGFALRVTGEGALEWVMSDGQSKSLHDTAAGVIPFDRPCLLAVVVDGGPKIVSFVINQQFYDGGDDRQFGWSRFSAEFASAQGSASLQVSPAVRCGKIYGRALMTCEAIQLQRGSLLSRSS